MFSGEAKLLVFECSGGKIQCISQDLTITEIILKSELSRKCVKMQLVYSRT